MSVKEKLEELLDDIQRDGNSFDDIERYGMRFPDTVSNEDVATHLIANGVTIQRWIPVGERLPENNDHVLVYCKNVTIAGGVVRHIGSYDNGFWFLATRPGTESFPHLEWEVTHWVPLPEPPKEVE